MYVSFAPGKLNYHIYIFVWFSVSIGLKGMECYKNLFSGLFNPL